MTKRYIDFAPVKTDAKKAPVRPATPKPAPVQPVATTVVVKRTVVRELTPVPVPKPVVKPVVKPVAKPVEKEEVFEPTAKTFAGSKDPFFGIIEDYEPVFVGTKVEKRPLSQPRVEPVKNEELIAAKSQKVRSPIFGSNFKKPAAKEAPKQPEAPKAPEIETLKTPTTPFIKSAQVEKRPLSKNVYKKPAPAPVNEPDGPVAIIDKPEKDTHIGPIIAIVLTIILGAAVGTVAFLLLPKK